MSNVRNLLTVLIVSIAIKFTMYLCLVLVIVPNFQMTLSSFLLLIVAAFLTDTKLNLKE